jgi:hypothetical protein
MADFSTIIQKFVKDGCLAWTLTSNGYKYLTWNFALWWKESCPGQPLLIVCADTPSFQFLTREGIRCVRMPELLADFGPQVVPFGSRQFATLNNTKLSLLNTFAKDERVQHCIYLDGDIIVYKNIVEDLRRRLEGGAEFLVQCDEQVQSCTATAETGCPNFCTGLIAFRHGAEKGCFRITDSARWKAKPEDQVWVNWSARELGVAVTVLPREDYPNGARLTLTKTTEGLLEKAFCLHYNYRVGTAKQADMKRFGDWRLPY